MEGSLFNDATAPCFDVEPYRATCEQFAIDVNPSTCYGERDGQNNANKRIKDQIVGKLGEFGACLYLRSKGWSVEYPDTNIYSSHEKNWSHDLLGKIAVKSQDTDSENKYGRSWVFQRSDTIHKNKETIVIFTSVNLTENKVFIRATRRVKDLIFEEMKLPQLRNTKQAVYWNNLNLEREVK